MLGGTGKFRQAVSPSGLTTNTEIEAVGPGRRHSLQLLKATRDKTWKSPREGKIVNSKAKLRKCMFSRILGFTNPKEWLCT